MTWCDDVSASIDRDQRAPSHMEYVGCIHRFVKGTEMTQHIVLATDGSAYSDAAARCIAGRNLLVQGGCLALLAADWAQAGDAVLLQRMLFPGLGEVLSVWGPLAFAGLFGWALRTARAL